MDKEELKRKMYKELNKLPKWMRDTLDPFKNPNWVYDATEIYPQALEKWLPDDMLDLTLTFKRLSMRDKSLMINTFPEIIETRERHNYNNGAEVFLREKSTTHLKSIVSKSEIKIVKLKSEIDRIKLQLPTPFPKIIVESSDCWYFLKLGNKLEICELILTRCKLIIQERMEENEEPENKVETKELRNQDEAAAIKIINKYLPLLRKTDPVLIGQDMKTFNKVTGQLSFLSIYLELLVSHKNLDLKFRYSTELFAEIFKVTISENSLRYPSNKPKYKEFKKTLEIELLKN